MSTTVSAWFSWGSGAPFAPYPSLAGGGVAHIDGMQWEALTLSRGMLSSLWRGTTVTISISATNATSEWVRPGGSGRAIADSVVTSPK